MYCIIAEDLSPDRYLLKVLLEQQGYQVTDVEHGRQALAAARTRRPDLIIADCMMPVMDGFMLLYTIRRDEHLHAVPVIIYTATYLDDEDDALALRLGADRVMHKPIDMAAMVREVQAVLEERRQDRPPVRRQMALSEHEFYVAYNQRLFVKLEDKQVQLDHANRLLRERGEEARRLEEQHLHLLHAAQLALHSRAADINRVTAELQTALRQLKTWVQATQRAMEQSRTEPVVTDPEQERPALADAIGLVQQFERLVAELATISGGPH